MKASLILSLFLVTTSAICQKVVVKNNDNYKAVGLVKSDSQFLSLKDTAQKYMPIFLDSLKKHGIDYQHYRFIIKSDFIEKNVHEHMWSQVVGYSKGNFIGLLVDSAFSLKNIKTGDKVTINRSAVEDWAIYGRNDLLLNGNFSDRYLKSKLDKQY